MAESACPYGKPDPSGPSSNYPNAKHLADAFGPGAQPSADTIKTLVQQYGGLHVSYYDDSGNAAYYNSANATYYYNGINSTNHAVLVVGWDDNFAASKFSTTPGQRGLAHQEQLGHLLGEPGATSGSPTTTRPSGTVPSTG